MMLKNCRECGKEISDEAAYCINCGAPIAAKKMIAKKNKGKNSFLKTIVLSFLSIIGFFFIIIFIYNISYHEKVVPAPKKTEQDLTKIEKPQPSPDPVIPFPGVDPDQIPKNCMFLKCSIAQNIVVKHPPQESPVCANIDIAAYIQKASMQNAIATNGEKLITSKNLIILAIQRGYLNAGLMCTIMQNGRNGIIVESDGNFFLVKFDGWDVPGWIPGQDIVPIDSSETEK
jgi:hypothetical protein